jgi:hypothetical protein
MLLEVPSVFPANAPKIDLFGSHVDNRLFLILLQQQVDFASGSIFYLVENHRFLDEKVESVQTCVSGKHKINEI